MSDIRNMLVETANKILKDFCMKELVMDAEKGIWPQELWNILNETGMTIAGIPEEVGGVGGDVGDALSLLRVAGKYAAPIPLAETFIANWLFSTSGREASTQALTVGPVRKEDQLNFTKIAGGWLVFGKLRDIPWARNVKEIALFGKTEDGKSIVTTVPLENCQINKGVNLAGEPRDEVVLTNIFILDESVAINTQVKEVDYWNISTLTRIVLMAGALEKVLELSVDYSNERSQFGRAIGKFQAIKQQLAVMAGEIVASSTAADSAVEAFCSGKMVNEVAMAKIQVGEASSLVTKIAHQVHGAMGFTDEHPLHLLTRRLWSWRDEYGTESEWAEFLGEQVLANGSENLWPMITSSLVTQKVN
ncbi:acyl-CoA dehydrogenase family protein [Neobacillus drentensis]|uniref:acyl-CoA dehydrogenase family protein n=1 Tax=Neobacillus drentensis TaxID=220684 RepID=UPI000825ECA6|nr:acyl-CoA dehydrogenase family protein [Neobacillus drentensis]